MKDKDKIRPLYSRLQGYLKQLPEGQNINSTLKNQPLCDNINLTLDQVSAINSIDLNIHRFTDVDYVNWNGKPHVAITSLRSKLGGIIAELHGTYFYDEPAPFSGMPHMVINQTSQQNQNVYVTIREELSKLVDSNMSKAKSNEEVNFLTQIREGLGTINNMADICTLILRIATSAGITLPVALRLLGH